ncbi:MAG: nuclear transport factor 2 family protein [Crinalium sp.]
MGTSVTKQQVLYAIKQRKSNVLLFLLTLLLTTLSGNGVWAETPATAPTQLKNLLTQVETAANRHEVKTVMGFYSPNFTNSDGLNRTAVEKGLTQLWQRYPQLSYRTELQSWQPQMNGFVAETLTYITGSQQRDGRNMKFNGTMRSRQYFTNGKIFKQDILSERTQLSTGKKPPTVDVNLPEKVRPGQEYNFDAIVKEPIGDDVLLGAAVEEQVRTTAYTQPKSYELEPLAAGGIFKVGKAPRKVGNYWVSAVLIRADGVTIVTRRLQVANN